jgi:hypothetical protein
MATAATATEISRLRRQLGLDETQLPDTEIADMFAEAEEDYPLTTYSRKVLFAAVRLQAAKDMLAESAQRVTYAQGQSRENQSDLMKNMKALVALYSHDLAALVAAEKPCLPPVRWGCSAIAPSVSLEYPDE